MSERRNDLGNAGGTALGNVGGRGGGALVLTSDGKRNPAVRCSRERKGAVSPPPIAALGDE